MGFSFRLLPAVRKLALCLWLCGGAALAQGAALEHQLKAAYLYKFAGFVQWPGSAVGQGGPLQIGVAGGIGRAHG